jgi:hypothetical protein
MSTVVSKNVQIGADGTASNNFTIYQPESPDGTLRIGNGNSGTTSAQVVLTSAGNVGIGTSSPAQALSVSGNIAATGSIDCGTQFLGLSTDSATAPSFSFTGDTDTGVFRTGTNSLGLTTGGTVRLTLSTSALVSTLPFDAPDGTAAQPAFTFSGDTNTGIFRPSSDTIAFAEGGVEAMRIDSSGRLLVGTTSTAGGASTKLYLRSGNQTWQAGPDSGGGFVVYNSSDVGVFISSGSTSWTAQSDERLKTTIKPFENAAQKVCTLRAGTGRYLTDDESVSRSFLIAQDVQKVLPEAVIVQPDERGTLGLAYTEVIPLLVASIQELKAELDAVKAQLATPSA